MAYAYQPGLHVQETSQQYSTVNRRYSVNMSGYAENLIPVELEWDLRQVECGLC